MSKQTCRWPWMVMIVGAVLVLGAWGVTAQDEPPRGPTVREIEVRFVGPETVNPTIVRANIQTAVGQPLSRELIEQDVRALINTGFFADVRVLEERVAEGIKVVYQVQGKAKIKDIVFEGNKRYKTDRLMREVKQKAGAVLNEHQARLDARQIEELYQKAAYPDVKVTPEVNVDKDTGRAVLRYKVAEGDRVFLHRVEFVGNKSIQSAVLLKQLKTKRYWFASWLTGGGTLKDEQLQADLEKIREFYWSKGFMDAEVRETKVTRSGQKWIVLRITLFEGPQYKIGTVKIEGAKLFPVAELQKKLQLTPNAVFNPTGQQKDAQAIEDHYGSRGYLDTTVRATRIPNVETGRLDLLYTIQEGQLCYIERIDIRGNSKTKDKVIRRELAVNPGDIYDTVRVRRSEERLKNLGYFSKVEATPVPTAVPNRKNLSLEVEEQRTGNITFGAGFSTIDSLLGFVEVTQGNFDLFNWPTFSGAGQKMRVRAQMGLERQDFILSFTEPWFLDRQLSVGFDLFHRFSGYLSDVYTEQRTGGSIRLGKPINPFLRLDTAFTVQYIKQFIGDTNVSQEVRTQSGEWLRDSLSATLTYDTRNNLFLTTRGQRTELTAELVGGPLGGDVSLYKLSARSAWYFPVFFKDHVLQLVAEGAVVDAFGKSRNSGAAFADTNTVTGVTKSGFANDVPLFDRYFLGGANSLRGFDYRRVGPKDVYGEPVGGNTMVDATVEYSMPVIERIRFAVFFDAGHVNAESYQVDFGDIKADVGAGVRLNLPVGPLRLDYGWPIITDRQSGRVGRIQFSVGYQF